tara:strand:+ start:38132 stop:39268 length:1137 start_codon:yes stop_codon:yes gene_type:complete
MNTLNKLLILLILFLNTACFNYVDIKFSQIKKEIDTGCKRESKEYYINGVNTKRVDARAQARSIEHISGKKYHLSYNYSEGIFNDLLQALKQIEKEVVSDSHLNFLTHMITFKRKKIYNDKEIKEINKLIEESKQYKLNIVSFSQGNLFANLICKNSKIKGNNYQIATPSLISTECQKGYSSFTGDEIVYLISKFDNPYFKVKKPNIKYIKYSRKEKFDILYQKWEKDILSRHDFEDIVFHNHNFFNYIGHKTVKSKIRNFTKKYGHKNHKKAIKVFLKGVDSESIVKSSTGKSEIYCSDILDKDIHYMTFSLQSVNKWLGVKIGERESQYLYIKDGEFISSKILEDKGSFKFRPYSTEKALKDKFNAPLNRILGYLN